MATTHALAARHYLQQALDVCRLALSEVAAEETDPVGPEGASREPIQDGMHCLRVAITLLGIDPPRRMAPKRATLLDLPEWEPVA